MSGVSIRAAIDLPATNASAGQHGRVGERVVVAAGTTVDLRRAAEVADHQHKRLVELASLFEVADQGEGRAVKDWQQPILEPVEIVSVSVPVVALAAVEVTGGHQHLHHWHAGFDESTGQQAALATEVLSV